jgi:peptide/nickel transport system substrate-binding protein
MRCWQRNKTHVVGRRHCPAPPLVYLHQSPPTDVLHNIGDTVAALDAIASVESAARATAGKVAARKHQMVLYQWSPDYFDPHSTADWFTHNDDNSENAKMRLAAWRQSWLIPELTNKTMAASRELDTTKHAVMYAELQKTVTDEGPYIFMF